MSTIKKANRSDVHRENALVLSSIIHLTKEVTRGVIIECDELSDRTGLHDDNLLTTMIAKSIEKQLLLGA